ncbi:MAG: hypothetical protein WC375_05615 [Methanomassiliicoccales archaeon]|jgi:hypothetical protein
MKNNLIWAAFITKTLNYRDGDNYDCSRIEDNEIAVGNIGESRDDFISRIIQEKCLISDIKDELKSGTGFFSISIDHIFQCTNIDSNYFDLRAHPSFLAIKQKAVQEFNAEVDQLNKQKEIERNRRDQQEYERLKNKFGN